MSIWFKNPVDFFLSESNWLRIIPIKGDPIEQQLNSLVVFACYFTIGILILKRDIRYIYVMIFVCVMTWIFYEYHQKENFKLEEIDRQQNIKRNPISGKTCIKPTTDNPYMNVMMNDYDKNPNRPPACNINNPVIEKEIADMIPNRENDDIYNKKASDRQFFANPSTTLPNRQDEFMEFAYKIPPTLKQSGQNF